MQQAIDLSTLGYSSHWEMLFKQHIAVGLAPARVVRSDRGSSLVATSAGIVRAQPSSRLLKSAVGPGDLPIVGDWVALFAPDNIDIPQIEVIMPRVSAITRGDPGRTSYAQVLAANVDVVFIVHPIARAPNLRRIERELSLAWESGAMPVIVLTKADLCDDLDVARDAVESVSFGVDIVVTNALAGDGVRQILSYVTNNRTAVLIGPSGAGKSTIINTLLGESRQATRNVRVSDGRGRHATVARQLIQMPCGGVLIDTPGLRALGLTGSSEGITSVFPDVEGIASSCRFRDCTHTDEPGCAVIAAVRSGRLPSSRLDSYHKLVREAEVEAAKTDVRLRTQEKRKSKTISKAAKDFFKHFGHK